MEEGWVVVVRVVVEACDIGIGDGGCDEGGGGDGVVARGWRR